MQLTIIPGLYKTQVVIENPLIVQTNAASMFDAINAYRQKHDLPPYQKNDATCQAVLELSANQDTNSDFLSTCPSCEAGAIVTISNQASAIRLIHEIETNQKDTRLVLGQDYTHLCIAESNSNLSLFFARFAPPSLNSQSANSNQKGLNQDSIEPTKTPKNFTEDELWRALADYRHAHTRHDLERDDKLCVYARKRVDEHLALFATTPKANYPRLDKYPLDAHSGFERDAESGELFAITDRRVVAENLAYWPSAEYPTQVIEWGWDTSTEGHREAQLSNDYTHACIAGKQGFYVAIFGRS